MIVQNKLKETKNDLLKRLLEDGHIRANKANGDNIFTSICVDRTSNLIKDKTKVLNVNFKENE